MSTLVSLPNGLKLHAPSPTEARVIYHEIFETDAYGKHGITVNDGDCVFDVGANVGFFSVYLARRRRALRLFAFEPLPPIFELLQKNAAAHLGEADAHLLCVGLGATAGAVTFRYDPQMTFSSSSAVASIEGSIQRDAGAMRWARALVADGGRSGQIPAPAARLLSRLLDIPGANLLTLAALGLVAVPVELLRRARFRDIVCPVRTLSEVLREHGVPRVDLVKIDVEGAEWDVLMGIDDADWPRLHQMVIEVHDADGRVARTADLLRRKGFEVVVDREDWAVHELLGIHTVYARRPGCARETGG